MKIEGEKMDIKLKDIVTVVRTSQTLRIDNVDDGEQFYPSYRELTSYGEYYVTDIISKDKELMISIKSQI